MKAKKPVVLAVLILALLIVALIVPAVASGKHVPHNWATWGGNVQLEWPLPWQATFQIHAQQRGTEITGREVMNWTSMVVPPHTPPKGHHLTTYIVETKFVDEDPSDSRLEEGGYKATIISRFDTQELGWDDIYPGIYNDYVYHVWVLIDNPGNGMDHLEIWSQMRDEGEGTPDINDSATWGTQLVPQPDPYPDLPVHGVQVVVNNGE